MRLRTDPLDPSPLPSAPCSPSIHNSSQICGTNSSLLSWRPMVDATSYTVNATTINGHEVSCSSATAACTLTDLMCSETYTATITAKGSYCDSAPSPSTNITTCECTNSSVSSTCSTLHLVNRHLYFVPSSVPCPPSITSKQYMCGNNSAVVRWTDPVGRLGFVAHVAGAGYQDSCHTTDTGCLFQNLPCGTRLDVSVQARGEHCNVTASVSESLQTGDGRGNAKRFLINQGDG